MTARIKTRLEPIERDVDLVISQDLSPEAQSRFLAQSAQAVITDARETNRNILGRYLPQTVTVDGVEGAPLSRVRPQGTIVAEFELFNEALMWIGDLLEQFSPVGRPPGDRHPGLYRRSHTLFADGVEVPLGTEVPLATEYVFINLVPYARKIELGSSSQAPDGVYQGVAVMAQRRFGNLASIRFSYRTAAEGVIIGGRAGNLSQNRQPAIVVRTR